MAAEKVGVDSKILPVLHGRMKDEIKKKVEEKGWDETKKEHFISGLLKLYNETVELALRENVVIQRQTSTSASKAEQEMETVDKERAKEVNEMCAKSEALLTCTIKKRKLYPQKIKESLRVKYDAQMADLQNLEDKVQEEIDGTNETGKEAQLDMTERESSWERLKSASKELTQFSKLLLETKEKFQRFNTVAKMKLKVEKNDLHQTLFSKRKLPSSFDSILATPSKNDKLDETTTEPDNISIKWTHQNELPGTKRLKGCVRNSPKKT